jgi:hypothetical protein
MSDKDSSPLTSKTSKASETPGREIKRKRLAQDEQFEDIAMDTVAQIIATIDDPNYMTGPDVSCIIISNEPQKKIYDGKCLKIHTSRLKTIVVPPLI